MLIGEPGVGTRQGIYAKRNMEARSRNHCCRGKRMYYIQSVVSVALVIQHAKRMRRVILSSVACLTSTIFFPHYLINGTIFGGKIY
jgi:hypothetical protein